MASADHLGKCKVAYEFDVAASKCPDAFENLIEEMVRDAKQANPNVNVWGRHTSTVKRLNKVRSSADYMITRLVKSPIVDEEGIPLEVPDPRVIDILTQRDDVYVVAFAVKSNKDESPYWKLTKDSGIPAALLLGQQYDVLDFKGSYQYTDSIVFNGGSEMIELLWEQLVNFNFNNRSFKNKKALNILFLKFVVLLAEGYRFSWVRKWIVDQMKRKSSIPLTNQNWTMIKSWDKICQLAYQLANGVVTQEDVDSMLDAMDVTLEQLQNGDVVEVLHYEVEYED